MATFGKVSNCAAAAAWLVEGYSGSGEDMSLDRIVYACEDHVPTAEAQWLRGLAPDTRPARGLHWCGVFTDYEGGAG